MVEEKLSKPKIVIHNHFAKPARDADGSTFELLFVSVRTGKEKTERVKAKNEAEATAYGRRREKEPLYAGYTLGRVNPIAHDASNNWQAKVEYPYTDAFGKKNTAITMINITAGSEAEARTKATSEINRIDKYRGGKIRSLRNY